MRKLSAEHIKLVWLLGFVLAVHLVVAYWSREGVPQDDALSYIQLGQNVAAGQGYVFEEGRPPISWRAPGYPLFLAAVFRMTGGSLAIARVTHAFLWVISALLTYRLALKLLENPRLALIAAGCVGFYPEFVGMTGLFWSESLFILLFLAAMNGLLVVANGTGPYQAIGAGLLIGLAALTRSTSVILLPTAWFVAVTRRDRPGAFKRALLMSVAALILIGGWSARNYAIHRKFILVESNVGFNLYVGNSPSTPMPFAWQKLKLLDSDDDYKRLVAGLNEADSNAALSRAAAAHMRAHPGRTLALMACKTFDFWLPDFFVAMNLRSGSFGPAYRGLWRPFLGLSILVYVLCGVAAVRGVIATPARWHVAFLGLVIVLYTLPHTLVYGASRYHLPLIPLVIILAAPELARWGERLSHRRSSCSQLQ
jgi:4-amino-4-deoxy-L-arabinose transferase-like glycosyltransferase